MTKEELIDKYKKYCELLPKGPGNDDTRNNYGSYLMALRFWAIDDILKNWFVVLKNKKYYETFDPLNTCKDKKGIVKASSKWNMDSCVECSERNYHLFNYYRTNIQNKNRFKEDKTQAYQSNLILDYDYLQDIAAFLAVNDIVHALTIIDIVFDIVQKAIDRYKYCKKESKNDNNTFVANHKNNFIKLNQSRRALAIMREWIEFGKEKIGDKEYLIFNQNVIDNKDPNADLDKKRLEIKESNLIHKIDGAIALVKEIGIDSFIQYAIEQSYFFKPKVVINRMTYIAETFVKRHENGKFEGKLYDLYARSSTKVASDDFFHEQEYEEDDNLQQEADYGQELVVNKEEQKNRRAKEVIERKKNGLPALRKNSKLDKYAVFKDKKYPVDNYPIIIDNDGNAAVRSLINKETGYTVSAGKSDIFQNYKISHIWGRAYDPRFFTNLWNIVLVPAWANDLLDKNAVEGTLESKLKSTIMSICKILYFSEIDDNQWNDLNLPKPSVINKGKDVVKPKVKVIGVEPKKRIPKEWVPNSDVPYLINIIEDKGSKTLGDIVKYAVYV